MGLDLWAGDLPSAVIRGGKAQVSESKQFKSLEDDLYHVTSSFPHTSLERGRAI